MNKTTEPNNKQSKPWYKNIKILLLILLFFPIAAPIALIWYTWTEAKWDKSVKIAVTAGVGLIFAIGLLINLIIIAFAAISPTASNTSRVVDQPTETSTPVLTPTATPTPKPAVVKDLDVTVENSSSSIRITNNENINWTNCSLKINDGIFGGGYTKVINLAAKEVLIINLNDFTKSDGTRFNSYETKPQNIFVGCDTPERRTNYFGFK